MPSYDRRKQELKARFDEAQATMNPIEIVRIAAVLENFNNTRDGVLTTIVTFASDESEDEEMLDDYWDRFRSGRDQLEQIMGDMLSGLSEVSETARAFRERAVVEEARFFDVLEAIDPCLARDRLLRLAGNLKEKQRLLERTWETMSEEDKRVEAIEWEAASKMTEIVKTAIEQEVALHLRIGNALGQVMQHISEMPDALNDALVDMAKAYIPEEYAKLIPKISSIGKDSVEAAKQLGIPIKEFVAAVPLLVRDPGMWAGDMAKDLFGKELSSLLALLSEVRKNLVPVLQDAYSQQVRTFKGQLPNQGGILVSLSNSRREADQFIKDNGVDAARALLDNALTGLERFASGLPTDAQKGDAADVARTIGDALKDRFEAMVDVFEAFVNQNRGRFLGPVSSETERALLRPDSWQEMEAGLVGLGLDEKLRLWRASTLEVTSRMTDAFTQVQSAFASLPIELQDGARRGVNEQWETAISAVRAAADDATKALEAAEKTAGAAQVKQDLNRAALTAQLRS